MSGTGDFVIENGILVDYRGTDSVVEIPEGVVGIDSYPFQYDECLEEVTLPESLQWVADGAFEECRNLRRLRLPDSLQIIPQSLCKNCESLTELVLPENVRCLSQDAFRNCALSSVTMPDSVKAIGDGCFQDCGQLRRLQLPRSLRTVPPSLCSGCKSLTELVLPDGVRYLSRDAFRNCALLSVTIPDSVRVIGERCFMSCRQLETVTLGAGLRRLEKSAFRECSALRAVRFPPSLWSTGGFAFAGCGALESTHMPEGLEMLGELAFWNCASLREVSLPESLEEIWLTSFQECDSLERIVIQGQRAAFRDPPPTLLPTPPLPPFTVIRAPGLLPEWLPVPFRPAALAGYLEIRGEECPLPQTVRDAWKAYNRRFPPASPDISPAEPFLIINGVLYGVARPKGQVTVPEGVVGIRAEAFQGSGVRRVRLPDSVQRLQPGTFRDCGHLESIRLPGGLTHIPDELFRNCQALRSIRIPKAVRRIGDRAFQASGLESLALPASVETVGVSAFDSCAQLRHVRFSEGLLEILPDAFRHCESLRQAELPDFLSLLGEGAFAYCGLEQARAGKGLTRLDSRSFRGCDRLRALEASADICALIPGDFPSPDGVFFLYLDASLFDIQELFPPDAEKYTERWFQDNQVPVLRIVAPNADPALVNPDYLTDLLRGFSSAEGGEFRYRDRYVELLAEGREEYWKDPEILRGFMRHDLLERKDLGPCLDTLQQSGMPELAAELLDYCSWRFPEPAVLELPPLDPES